MKKGLSNTSMMQVSATMVLMLAVDLAVSQHLDPDATIDCHRRPYSQKVTQFDSEGRMCWDMVTVMSCWGRCDSNEISDWRFPYKRSYHPVCIHGDTEVKIITLNNCDDEVAPGTEIHEFLEAVSCSCAPCKTTEASCEGLKYRGQRSFFGLQRG